MKFDRKETTGYILIILASCFFGGSASLGKTLMQNGISTIMLMEARSILSSLILFPALLLVKRKHLRIARKDFLLFVLLAIPGLALVNASYYYAIKLLTVAMAVFLQFTAPVLVFIYGWVTGKEKFGREKIEALILSLAGTYLMVKLQQNGGTVSWVGVISALLSTMAYAFYVILSHELGKKYSPWTIISFGYGIAALFWCAIQNPFETSHVLSTNHLWTKAILFSIFSTLIPFVLFLSGLQRISPTGATIASTSETVSATLFAYLFLGESLATGQIAGAVLIVSAIALLTYRKARTVDGISLTV